MSSQEEDPSDNEEQDPSDNMSKRRDRLEQNRISARESRKRKKTMIEELQRTVITLSKENKELNERNEALRRELMELGTKHPGMVPIQALIRSAVVGEGVVDGEEDSGGTAVGVGPADLELGTSARTFGTMSGITSDFVRNNNTANPQAAALPQVEGTSSTQHNQDILKQQQQAALMQQMLQMQVAGMLQPSMMSLNPAMMGMLGMNEIPSGQGQQQLNEPQNQQQQQQSKNQHDS